MRPSISINLAVSADGKISNAHGSPSGWTSDEDTRRLLRLRQGADALLVGRKTWLADQMTMCVAGSGKSPLRCIVSRSGDLPGDHPMFRTAGGDVHVLCTDSLPDGKAPAGIRFHHGTIEGFLEILHTDLSVETLHCEGGGWLVRELMKINAIDILHLTIAGHTVFGGSGAKTATGVPSGFDGLPSLGMKLMEFDPRPEAGECFLSYCRNPGQ